LCCRSNGKGWARSHGVEEGGGGLDAGVDFYLEAEGEGDYLGLELVIEKSSRI
jgi:hypothetical protein